MWRIRGRPPSWICDASSNRLFMVSTNSVLRHLHVDWFVNVRLTTDTVVT